MDRAHPKWLVWREVVSKATLEAVAIEGLEVVASGAAIQEVAMVVVAMEEVAMVVAVAAMEEALGEAIEEVDSEVVIKAEDTEVATEEEDSEEEIRTAVLVEAEEALVGEAVVMEVEVASKAE